MLHINQKFYNAFFHTNLCSIYCTFLVIIIDNLECTSPLGLENGAIYDDDISCTIPPSVTNDNACANECKYVRYNISSSKSYWCGSYDNNSYGYYKVNLNQFSLITGFAVESGKTCLHCGIKTIKFGYESERNGFNSTVSFLIYLYFTIC